MPRTSAVLGVTGNTGRSIVELLLQSPDDTIHAYCRDKPKFERLVPAAATDPRVKHFNGSIKDQALMVDCLRGTQVVYLCTSTNQNIPGYRVAQDLGATVIEALKQLRKEEGMAMPQIVVLSSASLSRELCKNSPAFLLWVLDRGGSYIKEDLRVQEEMLRAESEWLTSIFMKPGGLVVEKQRGHRLDLTTEESFISYLDLAAGMIEAGNDQDHRYDNRNVSVVNTTKPLPPPLIAPVTLLLGIVRHYAPWMHNVMPSSWP